jgi:hypothetical protein
MSQATLDEEEESSRDSPLSGGSPASKESEPVARVGERDLERTAQPRTDADQNWFRRPVHVKGERKQSMDAHTDLLMKKLEWETPEHLPGSPLCPLSPKYRGKYSDFCVYHGKRDDVGDAVCGPTAGDRWGVVGDLAWPEGARSPMVENDRWIFR